MTAARVYTPDPEGTCLVCGRPEGEHGRGAVVEPDDLTDAQIRDVHDSCMNGSPLAEDCLVAIGDLVLDEGDPEDNIAMAHDRIAAVINARRPTCPPAEVTAETVTREQIEALRLTQPDMNDLVEDCEVALGGRPWGERGSRTTRQAITDRIEARARVVAAINARAKGRR